MQNTTAKNGSTPLWSGRFEEALDPSLFGFNQSIEVDQRLWKADLQGTLAHARELKRLDVLTAEEFSSVENCILHWLETGGIPALREGRWRQFEDIHSLIESELCREIGAAGRRVHTGRSRNDQVVTAFRLTLRTELDSTLEKARYLQKSLVDLASKHREVILPGYTHLQRAQPILFAHYCLAYVEMLQRDIERAVSLRPRLNRLPLGSAALAGSPYPVDRNAIAAELGFDSICANSLDAVSDRDFCIEIASFASIAMMHLSRLSEDMILYSSREFGFLRLGDRVSTGSSLMPQKKNPDVPELIRGKSGPVFGNLQSLLVMMKGTPLAYNKDYQEDKAATFAALDNLNACLQAMGIFLANITLHSQAMRNSAQQGHLNATDLADYFVSLGTPFREAHEQAGLVVRIALERGCEIHELPLKLLQDVNPGTTEAVFTALALEVGLHKKQSVGSTHPGLVSEQLEKWCQVIARLIEN